MIIMNPKLTGIAKLSHDNPEIISGSNNPFYGRKHSEESLRIMREKRRLRVYEKICSMCGNKMISRVHNRLYCDDCRKIKDKEYMKKTDANRINSSKRIQQVRLSKRKYVQSDKGKEWQRLWNKTEKGKIRSKIGNIRRRERLAGVIKKYNRAQVLKKIEDTQGYCPICKVQFTRERKHWITLDHNPPLSLVPKGFVYTIDKIEIICQSCNSRRLNFPQKIIKNKEQI